MDVLLAAPPGDPRRGCWRECRSPASTSRAPGLADRTYLAEYTAFLARLPSPSRRPPAAALCAGAGGTPPTSRLRRPAAHLLASRIQDSTRRPRSSSVPLARRGERSRSRADGSRTPLDRGLDPANSVPRRGTSGSSRWDTAGASPSSTPGVLARFDRTLHPRPGSWWTASSALPTPGPDAALWAGSVVAAWHLLGAGPDLRVVLDLYGPRRHRGTLGRRPPASGSPIESASRRSRSTPSRGRGRR